MKNVKKTAAVILSAIMAFGLFGCGASSGESEDGGVDSINVLMWEGDASTDVFDEYEAETGIHVNVTYVEDTNIILEKMLLGNDEYDIVDLESAYIKNFVDGELLAPLDYETITNAENIDPEYMGEGKGAIGDENNTYTIPATGPLYTCVVYNKETCPIEINSFADLADPALEGEICSVNATISLYAGALQALGYPVNSTDDAQLQEAQELLTKIKKNVKVFVGASALSQLESGDCSVGYCWEYNMLCNDSKENWDKFEIVDSSCLGYNQYWAVSANSKKQDAAMELINYMEAPENVAITLEEYGGVPIISQDKIAEYLPDDYFESPYITRYKELWPSHVDLSVSDVQNGMMDTYYNELMAGTASE